jgi:hypothetical protein
MITGRHELLERYLADLERRLAAADPGERADILASVREHVESDLAALGRPATSADVAAALESLGSVDTVAAAWTPEDGGGAPAAPAPARPTSLAVAAGVLAGLCVLLIWLPPVAGLLGIAALVVGIVALRRRDEPRWAAVTAVVVGATSALLGLVLIVLPIALFTVHTETGEGGTDVVSVPAVSPAP